ncbi:hypothetical protein CAPTEDRAFT_227954 [Capitella teleta]|uniref:Methionyl/Valyl/Leucyl/Isoleucyl-tRNA synthetase anticodon-binding domain-containing protein n=1 Tax=Capitella teleta TaxID=283909 RepID=R7TKS0_CAPTE|nr:hypothetical protein CAPTEDRAFT_227954 [Capitella teleta]|eukprot:ELT94102.1 hypothetical protein CAPTEDRAFT_227954 [Capitella teleta]
MSKSVGNVIDPQAVINGTKVTDGKVKQPAYGVDVMRWWAAQSGLDAQMRKNFRYLMGNLADFDVETDRVPYDNLLPQDKYMLHQLAQLCSEVTADYESFKYNHVLHCLETFSNSQISSFYSNITKDRLYCNPAEHPLRRACQTVQYELLSAMTCFLAPILPHLAEEVFQHPPFLPVENSIFKTSWYEADAQWSDAEVEAVISSAFCVRDRFNNLITTESPVQFHVIISAKPRLFEHLRVLQPELTSSSSALCEILQSSYVTLLSRLPVAVPDEANVVDGLCVHKDSDGSEVKDAFSLVVIPSEDYPCDRCRLHTARRRRELCERCSELMLDGWEK